MVQRGCGRNNGVPARIATIYGDQSPWASIKTYAKAQRKELGNRNPTVHVGISPHSGSCSQLLENECLKS